MFLVHVRHRLCIFPIASRKMNKHLFLSASKTTIYYSFNTGCPFAILYVSHQTHILYQAQWGDGSISTLWNLQAHLAINNLTWLY